MDDLISRRDALEAVDKYRMCEHAISLTDLINDIPSAHRPTGRWTNNMNGTFTCDQCGCKHSRSNYCPNCGARMEGSE